MKYELTMLKKGMETFEQVIKAYAFLMSVNNINEVDLYNTFNIPESAESFGAYVNDDILEISYDQYYLKLSHNLIEFYKNEECGVFDEYDEEILIFSVQNPNDIINEETFFQASTVADLSGIEDGAEWFIVANRCYAEVMDFMESDDV